MAHKSIHEIFDLSGQSALVTGGASGIGQAIAFRLAEAGAKVMVTDIDEEGAQATAEEIRAKGGGGEALQTDISRIDHIERALAHSLETFGRLDILVNNAGTCAPCSVLNINEDQWDHMLDINLKGLFFFSKAASRAMIKDGKGGTIINIASMDAFHPSGYTAHYDASKGGVISLTKALAVEMAPHHIRVNAIAPGGIKTPLSKAILSAGGGDADEIMANDTERIAMRRWGDPDEIAKVALFLAGDGASYMTGSTIVADGGYLVS